MEHSRYFIEFSYCGSAYHGWQRQPNALSVQEVLEEALSRLLKQEISVIGAGRTDTGVHARQMFAHFDMVIEEKQAQELVFQLNNFLPIDIVISSLKKVRPGAHARFDAVERSYEYYLSIEKDPFNHPFHYYLKKAPDVDLMNDAAKILLNYNDFQCFSKSNTDVKTFLCNIKIADWQFNGKEFVFSITANRFLRNMVRAIVGTLLEIGLKKRKVEDLIHVIESKDRSQAGYSVPAKGLFLTEIIYPKDIYI